MEKVKIQCQVTADVDFARSAGFFFLATYHVKEVLDYSTTKLFLFEMETEKIKDVFSCVSFRFSQIDA